jgi:hypothetical protein
MFQMDKELNELNFQYQFHKQKGFYELKNIYFIIKLNIIFLLFQKKKKKLKNNNP